ncbi:type II secretion system protein [Fontivita pretiosa]|uniref:type II secretion system protein n=1 Tax=Fontivita pretiosa TaxID=2989684 RepID=UPI003D181375
MYSLGRRAFTLVELLVVIGIIALLISILLPVMSRVQGKARDLKCQTNLRSILQATMSYAADNKGSLPWGFDYNRTRLPAYDPAPGNGKAFICWVSLISRYMSSKSTPVLGMSDDDRYTFPEVFQCPEASQVYPHLVGYAANMVAMPSRYYEYVAGNNSPNRLKAPAKLGNVFPWTILFWDTTVSPGMENSVGYLLGADLDSSSVPQRFWQPEVPQFRFYSAHDPFAAYATGIYGNNRPVLFPSTWRNIDPPVADDMIRRSNGPGYPYQGNLRFRHLGNTAAMCAFADGHIEAVTAKFRSDKTIVPGTLSVARKNFMIKWPTGVTPDPSMPY